MEKILKNKVAIVTGAASGIGEATAKLFARHGASVALADVQEEAGRKVADTIELQGGTAIFLACDVSRPSDVQGLVSETVRQFGRLDCAFNNAGVEGVAASTVECTEENWDHTLNINLKGIWLCLKYEIPQILKQGIGGSLVNCSSIAGIVGFAGSPAYTASKHGVLGLTQSAALEFAKNGIRINAVCPGVIQTPMIDRYIKENPGAYSELLAREPIGRIGRPEEIAETALWLASDLSSFVTGHALVADGGWVAQ